MAENRVSKAFPVKPKLKPAAKNPSKTPESKYWSSYKTEPIPDLISSISSITFSPVSTHQFAAAYSTTLALYSPKNLDAIFSPKPLEVNDEDKKPSRITSFKDVVTSASFRSDGSLIAAADLSGLIQVFNVKSKNPLRKLRSHRRPVRFVKYPVLDKLHLVSGGDDGLVKYWDVAEETVVYDLKGHKDYVRCGDSSPVSPDSFLTGSYDHVVKLWDVRVGSGSRSVMEVNHGCPVEDVVFLPSGGLIASCGGNSVKIWDLISGGKLVYSMETHNKTVTSICNGRVLNNSGNEAPHDRILSIGLDGYMKVFDYANMKVTHSMRYPAPLMSVAFSPDGNVRVIGTSNGIMYIGKRKVKGNQESDSIQFPILGEPNRRPVLRPSFYRYFHRGQNEKPSEGDHLVTKSKKVKLPKHDKLLKKFRHKESLVCALGGDNPEDVVAVMEELVARRKLMKCVSIMDTDELGLLLKFLQKHSTVPRYSSLLMGFANKVVDMRAEDIRASDELKAHIRNLKSTVDEEIKIQQGLQEIRGILSPLLRIAGRR